jgi:hypothetical protein
VNANGARELLVSPVAWHHELVLLIPLYFFSAAIIASMLLNSTRVDRQFYAGAAITALGLLASVVLYFARITRGMQAHFFVLLASYAGGLLLLSSRRSRVSNAARDEFAPVVEQSG